jgi:DNA-binding CsgD family transcriptional regulator
VRVPVLRWSTISPVLTNLSQVYDPFAAVEQQRALRLREALDEARVFVLGSLTEAERRVVALLVREGLSDAQIAERLGLSRSTVGTHLEHIYNKARAHWELGELNRSQLVGLLNLYYTLNA